RRCRSNSDSRTPFVARELELPVYLPPVPGLCFLLRHADEDDPISYPTLLAETVGYVVFPLLVLELVDRDLLPLHQSLHRLAELLGDLPQHHRRRNRLAQLLAHEGDQAA